MSYNPLQDAKFLTLAIDALISLAVFFTGKYAAFALEDVLMVVGSIQLIAYALIKGFLQRDEAVIAEGKRLSFLSPKK